MSTPTPASHPDIRAALHARLLHLSPRAFEYFAGDLLTYLGLSEVQVTRYIGDAGLDATGQLLAGEFRIPAAVQVKRYRQNVPRPDIDRFVGALLPRYATGIFLTNADFSPGARDKLNEPVPRILPLNGTAIIALMLQHRLGVRPAATDDDGLVLDEDYFAEFEARANPSPSPAVAETQEGYDAGNAPPDPAADLISLRTLSYALRVDVNTVQRWVDSGKLAADASQQVGQRTAYSFRRDRIETIRQQFGLAELPTTGDAWRQAFLDFARSKQMSMSYKPVLLKVVLSLVDRSGQAPMAGVVRAFRNYYVQREVAGLVPEFKGDFASNPAQVSDARVQQLILKFPLDRFKIKGLMDYDPATDMIQIAPALWQSLRHYDVLDALAIADEQLAYYYERGGAAE